MKTIRRMRSRRALIVRIPMRFQRRGGWKRIIAPDGSKLVPGQSRTRTARWSGARPGRRSQKLLVDGVHASVTEIAEAQRNVLSIQS
jgi:hypothetical protein